MLLHLCLTLSHWAGKLIDEFNNSTLVGRGICMNPEKRLFFMNDIKKRDESMWSLNFIYVRWEFELVQTTSI